MAQSHPLMELRDMSFRHGSTSGPADGTPSSQLLEAMRHEITRHVEEVYSAEMASLKRRVDELEAAVRGLPGGTKSKKGSLASGVSGEGGRFSRPFTSMRERTDSSKSILSVPGRARQRSATSVTSANSSPGQQAPSSMKAHRGVTDELVLVNGHLVFKHELEEEEENAPLGCLPESLFNYCVERLAVSEQSWRDPSVGFLVLLTLSQNLLMNGFSQMNFKAMVQQHWDPLDQRPKVLMDCIYADRTFMGEPVLFLLVVLVGLVIVALVIKSVTDASLMVMFPDRDSKRGIWFFVNLVWFQQMVFIPAVFSVEAAALFSSSADTSALIMNTLAVAFILDVDKILYSSLLSDSQKAEYQALASHEDRPRRTRRMRRSSWLLFWCCLLQMCVHFLCIRVVLDDFSGRGFIRGTLPLYFTYFIGSGLRGAVQMWAHRPAGDSWAGPGDVANFAICAVAMPVQFFAFFSVTIGNIDPYFQSHCFERSLCISSEAC